MAATNQSRKSIHTLLTKFVVILSLLLPNVYFPVQTFLVLPKIVFDITFCYIDSYHIVPDTHKNCLNVNTCLFYYTWLI